MKIVVTGLRGFPLIQGGVETHCQELYPRLVQLGCDVTVVRRKPYVKKSMTEFQGVKFKDVFTLQIAGWEAAIHTLFSVLYAYHVKADILHIHAIGPAFMVPLAKMLGLKVVATHHGPDYQRCKWGGFAKIILKLGEKFMAKWADQIIAISTVIQHDLEKKYQRKDTTLIYNGVNPPQFVPSTHYIESLGLTKQKYVLAVGRFVAEKNFDKLIQAFGKIQHKYTYKLVIAGDADHPNNYSEKLKYDANIHGVVLTGLIHGEQIQELYTHATLFVLPSSHEGLPITLLEAMSYGVDVLVTDIPANAAVGLPADCYFPYGEHMIDRLALALENKLHHSHPRQYDLKPYNWDHIARQTLALYQHVIMN